MSATAIAELWGISPMGVSKWVSRDGCPRNKDRTYSLPAVIAWREQRLREKAKDASVKERKAEAEVRRLDEQIRKLELQNDQAAGLLIDAAEVERGRIERIRLVKKGLSTLVRTLPARLSALSDQAEIERILRAKIDDICNGFARE